LRLLSAEERYSHRITTDTVSAESKIVRSSGQIFADGAAIELVASTSGNRLDLLFVNGQKNLSSLLSNLTARTMPSSEGPHFLLDVFAARLE
jgi:hypothetical protein